MAVIREGSGIGVYSGRLDTVVFARTKSGTVMRARPQGRRERTPLQQEGDRRLRLVNAAWDALSHEDVVAWRRFAAERGGDGYRTFVALSTKLLQARAGATLPTRPPEGVFFGDALAVTVAPEPLTPPGERGSGKGALEFASFGANRSGMLTELLGQWVPGPHNAPKPKSYASLGFVAFEAGTLASVSVPKAGTWVCAVRFVEEATGRMTDPVEIGRARVAPS